MTSRSNPSSADTSRRPRGHSSHALAEVTDIIDRSVHANVARFTGGLAPAALMEVWLDWAIHLAGSPGKRLRLAEKAVRQSARLVNYVREQAQDPTIEPCIEPLPQDHRFAAPAWQKWPFNVAYQTFLLQQQWWHSATTGVRGVTAPHEAVLQFASRQFLDTLAPSNFVLTNPELLQKTVEEQGANLVRGMQFLAEDMQRTAAGKGPVGVEAFEVGRNVAITPGKVIYRNRLIELIQYAPATDTVRPEPILIVPAWIMKYYILDLSPGNSLVRYLTGQGYTVFMISWLNPGPPERDLGMKDYRTLGVMDALDAVGKVLPGEKVHAVGYCLGGTLLSIAAAHMAREKDKRLASVSLLAAQTDFTEAGELTLFINESQLTFLEDMMWENGGLKASQMAGTFQLLRSNDLLWSRMINEYLMGERNTVTDMTAWNADTTRMPYRMHAEYLRRMFLNNDLAEGRYEVDDRPIALTDIRAPIFALGTLTDHVAPWRSAFKIHRLTDTEVTFALTSGGHNAGVVSEPGHPRRHFQILTRQHDDSAMDPDTWIDMAGRHEGSWWPAWVDWLGARSGAPVAPPPMGAPASGLAPLGDAPGTYVYEH